jgi:hypothetical protein
MNMKSTLKSFAAVTAFASVVATLPALALTPAETAALAKQVSSTKVVELPAVATKLINQAAQADREATAVTVVRSGLTKYPGSLTPLLTTVAKAAPETTEAIAKAAIAMYPDAGLSIVSALSDAAPTESAKVVTAVSKVQPKQRAAFEQQAAFVQSRRAAVNTSPIGAAFSSGTPVTTPSTNTVTVTEVPNLYPGADPARP